MENNIIYWLWLQNGMGAAANVRTLLSEYKTAKEFYDAGESAWKNKKIRLAARSRLLKSKPSDFSDTIDFCKRYNIFIVTPDSEYYPSGLLEIENYPLALYVRGDYKILNQNKTIAVIGSRTPCVYGEKAAKKIAAQLAENGYLIVSGGALGIDSVAHRTAIESGGKTVLIMGCGHGSDYLPENSPLRKAVAANGALVSEYPPKAPVTYGSFPLRNRLISGMAKGVVIVEAAEHSGTFSTANHALDQSRDVFVLPGDIESGNFAGSNKLITEGAIPVFSGEDIIEFYGENIIRKTDNSEKTGKAFPDIGIESAFSKKNGRKKSESKITEPKKVRKKADEISKTDKNREKKEKNSPEGISKNASIVYNIMSEGFCELDEIKRKSELDIRQVLIALTELEMLGVAESIGPAKYSLK